MGKIIFLDVDGTLVDYENHIPESAAEAVKKARKNRHRVYICTGRSKAEVYEEIWSIGLDGFLQQDLNPQDSGKAPEKAV